MLSRWGILAALCEAARRQAVCHAPGQDLGTGGSPQGWGQECPPHPGHHQGLALPPAPGMADRFRNEHGSCSCERYWKHASISCSPSEPTQLETKRTNMNKMQRMEQPPVSRDAAGVAMSSSQLLVLTRQKPLIFGSIFITSHIFPPPWAVRLSFGLHLTASVQVYLWKEPSFLLICGSLL